MRNLGANEILEMVFIYMTEVSSLRDYDDIIMVLANMGKALTSAERCSVWIVNEEKKTIWTKVAHGIDPIEIPMDSGLVGDAIVHGKKILIEDAYKDSRFNQEIDRKTGYKTRNMMIIPMFDYQDNIIGAFQVINHIGERETFDERDMERLMLASTYAAETIIAARLEEEIEETQKELIFTMGAIGESRSKETGNHVKRVAEYSKILALASGMDEKEAELLKQASPMHDIGKIAIPDAILKKPCAFDKHEHQIMKRHAELGYQMIKSSKRPLLQAAAIVAHEHHEKWDGSGYPRKLAGEEIHIYGRITALADVFDALGSNRVYKKAWSDEKIFELIRKERGKHFDPKLVDLFFENIDKILQVREKFKDAFDDKNEENAKKENIKILGAYGTRAKNFGTSSILLNQTSVLDAGNLLDALGASSVAIEEVWLTHSHLDHIVDIAYILDNYFTSRKESLVIYGLPETIQAIRENFLNDTVWPDFSSIKLYGSDKMAVVYREIEAGKTYAISDTETLEAFETDHTVACCGYIYTKNDASIMVCADTYSLDNVIDILNRRKEIRSLIVECSFANSMEQLAKESKHLTASLLFSQLNRLKRDDIDLYINHVKPTYLEKISIEVEENRGKWKPQILKDEDFVYFS
jgi:HD-GYP domain-containing protein (c-di-GMP phosphodiesterase class II)/ribonuclease BN (tRNA processing enzyme)